MRNDPKGSLWRKWDLHVHTPASIHQEYGENIDATWEKFITDLENLPPEFKVIGVNDYIFIDGYKRLRAEKLKGRLANIELLLPVIELRLDKFAGTEGHWNKVNLHIIFSDVVPEDVIEAQFINALATYYKLSPEHSDLEKNWGAVPTKKSLEELGNLIIESVPIEKKSQFTSPLIEGFNNLNIDIKNVLDILRKPCFDGKYLLSVGKTEWASMKWNDHSIAEKKNIINSVQFVFTSADNVEDCKNSLKQLRASNVNPRLLDCSDAHRFSDVSVKDRIGKCFTWLKADLNFDGLMQAYTEYDQRIYLGDMPQKHRVVDQNKTKYLHSIHIDKQAESTLNEIWFDNVRLEFNQDLIAIIGNKGTGKSALSDILGLLGNTKNQDSFSFLNPKRFCTPSRNLSEHFFAELSWCNGTVRTRRLDDATDNNLGEFVKYIPQGLFDKICNEIPGGEETDFDKELKKVIFSHVEVANRLGKDTLDELIAYRTNEVQDAIRLLTNQLSELNLAIVDLEAKTKPAYKEQIENSISLKTEELETHISSKPAEEQAPEISANEDIRRILQDIEKLSKKRGKLYENAEKLQDEDASLSLQGSIAEKILAQIENLKNYYQSFKNEAEADLQKIGFSIEEIVTFTYNTQPILKKKQELDERKEQIREKLDPENEKSVTCQINQLEIKLQRLQEQLDEPNRRHQAYLEKLDQWEQKHKIIMGDENTPDTLTYYQFLLSEITNAPEHLGQLKEKRTDLVRQIYSKIKAFADIYRNLYNPVQKFIETHPLARDKFKLRFDVSIVNVDFQDKFFAWIGKNRIGSFYGGDTGEKILSQILQRYDLNSEEGVICFLDDIEDHLTHDKRVSPATSVEIESQLRRGQSVAPLYDFLYSLNYLIPRYLLKLGDKDLSQLSPGERGSVLLIFYLLIDKDLIPLIIDQPEGNLDNQTIYQLLVDAIKDAKQKRQIIIVTHNPNLAVVCDAEQIICCSIDKEGGNKITYVSGAIENPIIKKNIIDILEGTKPAFDNRKFKYEPGLQIG